MIEALRTRRAGGLAALVVLAVGLVASSAGPALADTEEPPAPVAVSEEDASLRAAIVAAEDRRVAEARTAVSLARWSDETMEDPYRLRTDRGYTLVLTPRSAAYTVDDLRALAPQTFVEQDEGAYLLSEHVVVLPGARLVLSAPGGLDLRMASDSSGFATILSLGGRLEILGEEGAEASVTSWDVETGQADEVTNDGRAYIRSVGGQFVAEHVRFSDLGFWSGRTGGVALTGTDRPNTGALGTAGADTSSDGGAADAAATSAEPSAGSDAASEPDSLLDDVSVLPVGPVDGAAEDPLAYSVPDRDFVSALLDHVTVEGDAFGLFVSGADGLQVRDSVFSDNELGGVLLHRYVTNATVANVTAARNQGDGITVSRASSAVTITEATATANAGSGVVINGRPLADGPSAVGAPLNSYGGNVISNSTVTDNGRYGIEVRGGVRIGVQNNVVEGHEMGIIVNGPSESVTVSGNTVRSSGQHGIAVVNGVVDASVANNQVDGASTGVYVRDSQVSVNGNTVNGASSHGVSLVGDVDDSSVTANVVAGSGPSAVDLHRGDGHVDQGSNNVSGWDDSTPWYHVLSNLMHPMNALWALIALILILSALRSRDADGSFRHPYAHQRLEAQERPEPPPDVIDLRDGVEPVPNAV